MKPWSHPVLVMTNAIQMLGARGCLSMFSHAYVILDGLEMVLSAVEIQI